MMLVDVNKIDELYLAATIGKWGWAWRKDDEQAPGSIHSGIDTGTGHSYAVAMCPRYGKDRFPADAEFIVEIHNSWTAISEELRVLRKLFLASREMQDARVSDDPFNDGIARADWRDALKAAQEVLG